MGTPVQGIQGKEAAGNGGWMGLGKEEAELRCGSVPGASVHRLPRFPRVRCGVLLPGWDIGVGALLNIYGTVTWPHAVQEESGI